MVPSVTCPICNKQLKRINNAHLRMHNHTFESFAQAFPTAALESPELRKTYGTQSSDVRNKARNTLLTQKQLREETYYAAPKLCITCKTVIPYNKHQTNQFCGRACGAAHTNKTRTLTPAAKLNIKNKAKLNKQRLLQYTRTRQEQHPPFTKVFFNVCGVCSASFVAKKSTNKTCSPTCKSQWHSKHNFRQNKTFGKCGYFNDIWCASSWELAFVAFHLYHNKVVSRYTGHFEYEHNGKTKRYFPDFIIDDVIYEVKGRMDDTVQLKLDTVKRAGYHIELVTREQIVPMIHHVQHAYNVDDIVSLYS